MSEFKWFSAHRSNQVHFQSSKKSNKLAFKNDILEAAKKYFPVCVNENRFVCLSFYPNFIYLHFTCSAINYFVPFFYKNKYGNTTTIYVISIILYKSHSTDGSTNLYINSYIQKWVYTYGQSSSPFMVNYINYKQKMQ